MLKEDHSEKHQREEDGKWDRIYLGEEDGVRYIRYERRRRESPGAELTISENGWLEFETSNPVLQYLGGEKRSSVPREYASFIVDEFHSGEIGSDDFERLAQWTRQLEDDIRDDPPA